MEPYLQSTTDTTDFVLVLIVPKLFMWRHVSESILYNDFV